MSDLIEFLLARIAEDEALVDGDFRRDEPREGIAYGEVGAIDEVLMVSPARVSGECAAKRRIVDVADRMLRDAEDSPDMSTKERMLTASSAWAILKSAATVYADHEDYRDEWRP